MALFISHLSKTFPNGLETLTDISLHVNKGEFVSIIGPSGCGKSTILKILCGIQQPTSGEIKSEIKHFGYMPQQPLLLPWRTVEDNIVLGLDIKKENKQTSRKKARALLEEFKLTQFAHYYPSQLSGGMQQRVALLRTILFNQEFLLLDEPFGALDALTRQSLQLWLLDMLKKFNPSILFITHDIREAIFLSNRIYVMSQRPGKIIAEIAVKLSRPRTINMITSKTFINLEKELLHCLTDPLLLVNNRTIEQ